MSLNEIIKKIKKDFFRVLNSPFGALSALGVGLIAQLLLENDKIFFAIILYFYAAIGFVVSTQNVKLPELNFSLPKKQIDKSRYRSGLIIAGFAVFLSILSFLQFDNNFPILAPWVLHFISIGLLILSAILLDGKKSSGLKRKKILDECGNHYFICNPFVGLVPTPLPVRPNSFWALV